MTPILISNLPTRPFVFVFEDQIYTSPNSAKLPNLSASRSGLVKDTPVPATTQQTHWADSRHPFLPYVPLRPRYDRPPLDRLVCVTREFPVHQNEASWFLASTTAKQWERLENNLLYIARYLQHASSKIHLPAEFCLVSRPNEYGYKRGHRSKAEAERAAKASRDAFLPLMAWCSYVLSHDHVTVTARNSSKKHLRWELLLYGSAMNADSIEELKSSELVDFSPDYRRAGLLLPHDCFLFHGMVPRLRRDNIPVWIHWGKVGSKPGKCGPLERFMPTPVEITQANKAREAEIAASWTSVARSAPLVCRAIDDETHDRPTSPPVPNTQSIPEPEPLSGQKRGETWREYFSRMAKKREQKLATETQKAKESRLSKEKAQKNHPCPGKGSKAPIVFHWTEDDETRFRIRTRVCRQMVPDTWENYTNTQRVYNSLTNEWDVCSEFDADAVPESDHSDDNDDFFGVKVGKEISLRTSSPPHANPEVVPPTPSLATYGLTEPENSTSIGDGDNDPFSIQIDREVPSSQVSSHTNTEPAALTPSVAADDSTVLTDVFPAQAKSSSHTNLEFAPDSTMPALLSTTSQERPLSALSPQPTALGSTPLAAAPASQQVAVSPSEFHFEHAEHFTHPSTGSKLTIPDHTIATLRERYGFLDSGCTNGPKYEFQTSWSNIMKILGRKDASIELKLRAPISHFVECMISSQHNPPGRLWDLSPDSSEELVDYANPEIRVTRMVDTGVHYLLSAKRASDNDVPWQLVLDDAVTILECLRQERTSIRAIAAYLFSTGRPFSTGIRPEQCHPPRNTPPVTLLGCRLPSHRPTTYEYCYYEEIRANFFRHPHSRAAAYKMGGIIWRLSLESTNALIDDIVLDGPSDEVMSHGSHIGGELWDDNISEDEMDLICGVYKVLTGESFCHCIHTCSNS